MKNFFKFDRQALMKSPIWPALISAVIAPGFGQILNREIAKGIFLLTVFLGVLLWCMRVVTQQLVLHVTLDPTQWDKNPAMIKEALFKIVQQNPSMFVTFEILILFLWVYSIVDAYVTARKRCRTDSV